MRTAASSLDVGHPGNVEVVTAETERVEGLAVVTGRPPRAGVENQGTDMQWWGYSKEHGWVVLDRTIPANAPGLKTDLLFVRCRDAMLIGAKRESWNPPSYRFAPNYIRDLAPPASEEAAVELEGLKLRWPEFELELQRDRRETEERAEAARLAEEKARKQEASEKRKLAAAAKV